MGLRTAMVDFGCIFGRSCSRIGEISAYLDSVRKANHSQVHDGVLTTHRRITMYRSRVSSSPSLSQISRFRTYIKSLACAWLFIHTARQHQLSFPSEVNNTKHLIASSAKIDLNTCTFGMCLPHRGMEPPCFPGRINSRTSILLLPSSTYEQSVQYMFLQSH